VVRGSGASTPVHAAPDREAGAAASCQATEVADLEVASRCRSRASCRRTGSADVSGGDLPRLQRSGGFVSTPAAFWRLRLRRLPNWSGNPSSFRSCRLCANLPEAWAWTIPPPRRGAGFRTCRHPPANGGDPAAERVGGGSSQPRLPAGRGQRSGWGRTVAPAEASVPGESHPPAGRGQRSGLLLRPEGRSRSTG
jgi:hypothetical protein